MLHFKISLESVTWTNHRDFTKEDVLWVQETAKKNQVSWFINTAVQRQFHGEWENLYCFLHDVCYKYDIELV